MLDILKGIGALILGLVILVLWVVLYAAILAAIVALVLFFLKVFGIDVLEMLGM